MRAHVRDLAAALIALDARQRQAVATALTMPDGDRDALAALLRRRTEAAAPVSRSEPK